MNTIRKKIMILSAVIWAIMLLIWVLMNYSNQKTIEKYNEILQRYMLMNNISQLSENSITVLNQYMSNKNPELKLAYLSSSEDMKAKQQQLYLLKNQNNYITLMNYDYMISSQLESMKLAISFYQNNDGTLAAYHFNEAAKESKYISETTLSLLSHDLTTYDDFYREIIQQSNDLKKMSIWTLTVTSFMVLLLFYKFSNDITNPILTLTIAAREISRGNFDSSIEVHTNDEIRFLAVTFDRMRMNIKNLISEMHNKAQVERDLQEHKLLLKESELKSLQSQINPHFLFNTLNTLSKKAYLDGAMETSDLIISVSELLRYNLKSLDASVTLSSEIKGLEDYLAIQKARFAGRVHYMLNTDEACLNFVVPSLTLQPFVENAFIHAIEPFEKGGTITIGIHDEPERVVIQIMDNGPGIPQQTVSAIVAGQLQKEYKGHSTGIGIGNVIRRLQLFYGVHDVITILSSPEQGTCVTLLLPKQRREQFD
jgi:sensor histidine kinase YesM